MSAERLTAQRREWIAERLDDRDQAVIHTLANVRVATGRQLQRLYFPSTSGTERARQSRRLLQRLTDLGILCRLERRIGGVRAGSAGHVFALDRMGQYLVGSGGPAGGQRRRRPWTPSMPFLRHALTVTEVYVTLSEATRDGPCALRRFDVEPACWRRYPGIGGGAQWCKPDVYVVIDLPEVELSYFVEVDLGTHSRSSLARKFETYRRYHASGVEQRHRQIFPRVLWLTDTERRRAELVDVAGRQPAESWRLFQVGPLPDAATLITTPPRT